MVQRCLNTTYIENVSELQVSTGSLKHFFDDQSETVSCFFGKMDIFQFFLYTTSKTRCFLITDSIMIKKREVFSVFDTYCKYWRTSKFYKTRIIRGEH